METWSRSSAFGNVPLKQSSKKNVNLGLLYGNCKLPRAFTHKQNRYNITKTNSACVVSYVLSKMINILNPVPFFFSFLFFFFFLSFLFFFLLFTSCEASLQIFSPQKSIFRSPSMCPNFSYFKVNNENGFELCCSYADFASFPFLLSGVLGLVGCLVFVGKTESSSEAIYATYSWSFYFTIIGSIVVFVASIVILFGGKTVQKSWRVRLPQTNVTQEPVRRFSHLWARQSPSTPEGARRQIGSAVPRDFTSFPPATPPTTPDRNNRSTTATPAEDGGGQEQSSPKKVRF